MPELVISMQPRGGQSAKELHHEYGNLADDVWKEKLGLIRTRIAGDRIEAVMEIFSGRPLRKRERDELEQRIAMLARQRPETDPRLVFPESA